MRFSAVELRRFFFQPLEFHLELPDFLVELGFLLRRFRRPRRRFGREDLGEPPEHFFLPLTHLHGMNLVSRRYRMHRLYAFKCFQPNLGLEFGTEFPSVFIGHDLDRLSGLDLTIPSVQFSGATSKKTVSIERQVRIAAGSLVVLGVILSTTLNPAFIYLSAFVGAGLAFAGITNTCMMGLMLAKMPWNR